MSLVSLTPWDLVQVKVSNENSVHMRVRQIHTLPGQTNKVARVAHKLNHEAGFSSNKMSNDNMSPPKSKTALERGLVTPAQRSKKMRPSGTGNVVDEITAGKGESCGFKSTSEETS